MRIFYQYCFDITKSVPIQDSYKTVSSLMDYLGVTYKDILFKFYDFVDKKSKVSAKNKIERIFDVYPQCEDYYFCNPCSFASGINYVGFTNCEPDNWNKIKSNDSVIYNLIGEIIFKIPKPWNIGYQIAFNQINWFDGTIPQIEITSRNKNRVQILHPMSSNISIGWNSNERKNKIILSFEITESTKNCEKYIEETAAFLHTSYKDFDSYIYFEDEEILENKAVEKSLKPIINEYAKKIFDSGIKKLMVENGSGTISPRKAICKIIKHLDYIYNGCDNGIYTISKVDRYNHQIMIYLDYADGIISAALRYTGINFLYSFDIKEIQPKFQEEIEEYLKYILTTVNKLGENLFNIISDNYPETPSWFIYSNS